MKQKIECPSCLSTNITQFNAFFQEEKFCICEKCKCKFSGEVETQ